MVDSAERLASATGQAAVEPSEDLAARGELLLQSIRDRLPGVRLVTDPLDLEAYRRDETAHLEPPRPLAAALPDTTAQVAELVRLAAEQRVPVVPRGAGTGLSGGSVAVTGGLTIVFTRMNRILEIDHANLCVVTQPGILNAELKAAVAAEGLFYPPDPASYEICSIGGNLGTNAGGLCCVKYGVTRDAVLGLEVVLADGAVVRLGGKNVKDVAGYGLMQLIVGSQGTLALVTEATLRLRPAPPPKATLVAFFASLEAAGEAVAALTEGGVQPCTLELMDRFTIAAVDDWQELGLDRTAEAMLLVESDLPGAAAEDEVDRASAFCQAAGATLLVRAASAQEADWLRQGRRSAFRALERLGSALMEDVAVPRSEVPEMLRRIEAIAERHSIRTGTFGHVGDGNLHPTFVTDRDDPAAAGLLERVKDDLYRAAIELGGTVTGEHGVGLSRKAYMELQRGPDALRVMRAIKGAMDPLGILNPGKML